MNIIAIDPGKVTGIAVWHGSGKPDTYEVEGGIHGFVDWWNDRAAPLPDLIAIEDWMVRPNTHKLTPEPDAYLIIGGMQMWARTQRVHFHKIGPGEHKTFNGKGKAMKTRRLGWGVRSKDNHHEDACSVLLTALTRYDRVTATALLNDIAADV